ncbi:MAG: TIGR00288 family NYN domain-containing protein [Candidatus Marsarchaeota archaeon]|nr:TIGR00288 family NYN domain-containing protein [Candidatus Marsarchaeota archaeon]
MANGLLDRLLGAGQKPATPRIALMVDGPNIIRRDVRIDLLSVRNLVAQHGQVKVAKVFLDQYASDKLIEAMVNQGYEPVLTTGDVDVTMAVEATVQAFNPHIDTIALMTRDIDFRPVLVKAKEMGKHTIVIGTEPGFSVGLRQAADVVIMAQSLREK